MCYKNLNTVFDFFKNFFDYFFVIESMHHSVLNVEGVLPHFGA